MNRIAIVGLGQIGGSIVLTLRKNHAPYRITGIDTSSRRLRLLEGHLDQVDNNWAAAASSDLVVLCLHYDLTAEFLRQAPRNQLITDVCSGKSSLLRLANLRKLRFVGGHPMSGNEFEVEKGWRDQLFANAPYFLCPGKHSKPQDLKNVRRFVRALDAKPIEVTAKMHDRFVSKTSHFPAFLALMLKQMAEDVPIEFQGPGFRSMIRLAQTSPALLNTFMESNRSNILDTAQDLKNQLQAFIFNAKAQRRKVR